MTPVRLRKLCSVSIVVVVEMKVPEMKKIYSSARMII